MLRWCIAASALSCASTAGVAFHRQPLASPTTEDLVSVFCAPDGGVSALDAQGHRHDLRGPGAPMLSARYRAIAQAGDHVYRAQGSSLEHSTDGGKTWTAASPGRLVNAVPYGQMQIQRIAIAPGRRVLVLGEYSAIGNSLEDAYGYLLRSDDRGATWSEVWTGPNHGPMGGPAGPSDRELGLALVVLPDGTIAATAATGGSVLVSTDGGDSFASRPTPAREPLSDLAIGPGGTVYGVGRRGTAVISTDGARTFAVQPTGVTEDLAAVASCGGSVWIVGAHGTVLAH
jgi:photosystem II stability/assembly factor-like uncharacterized protein